MSRKSLACFLHTKKNILIWLYLILVPVLSHSQISMEVDTPESIQYMMTRWIEKNKINTTTKAWRVQILSTDDRRKMEQTQTKFQQLYPDIPLSWKHVSPYYQIRVGAFRSKTELFGLLTLLKNDFPSSTPVLDDIEKLDLINFQYTDWDTRNE